jgi:hypothetical protein
MVRQKEEEREGERVRERESLGWIKTLCLWVDSQDLFSLVRIRDRVRVGGLGIGLGLGF